MNNMNKLNVDRLMKVLSELLSDKYDVRVTLTARPKERDQLAS